MSGKRWINWAPLVSIAALVVVIAAGCPEETETVEFTGEPEMIVADPGMDSAEVARMGQIVKVDEETFEQFVLGAQVPVLVDFYADWCPPCREMVPALEAIADGYAGRAMVVKVDVDDNPGLAQEYGVHSLPTLVVISDGEVVDRTVGSQPRRNLEQMLDRELG